MGLEGGYRHSTSRHPGRPAGGNGEAGPEPGRGEAHSASQRDEGSGREDLLAQVLSRENMVLAWKRVEANKGSAGVDGLTIEQTAEVLKTQWPKIREELESGQYRPQAVRRVEIPKPGGGIRELGIPTVVDRLIQQGLLQVLQPLIDPTFSEFSYGFRPGRSVQLRSPLEERNSTHTEALDTKLVTCYNGRHDIISNTLPTSGVRSHQS